MKAHITLHVSVDPGTSIQYAFEESVQLADQLDIMVEFKFNDVTCFAYPNGNVANGVTDYNEAIASKRQYKFASAR